MGFWGILGAAGQATAWFRAAGVETPPHRPCRNLSDYFVPQPSILTPEGGDLQFARNATCRQIAENKEGCGLDCIDSSRLQTLFEAGKFVGTSDFGPQRFSC